MDSFHPFLKEVVVPVSLRDTLDEAMKKFHRPLKPAHKRHEGNCYGNQDCDVFMTGFDCDKSCPSKKCNNRILEKGLVFKDWEQRATKTCGYKLVVTKDVPKHSYIGEYVGILKTEAQHEKEMKESKDGAFYAMSLFEGSGLIIDAVSLGNYTRWINHSCAPNLELKVCYGSTHFPRLMFHATQDIKAGSEVTYNYNASFYGDYKMECLCEICKYKQARLPKQQDQKSTFPCTICSKVFTQKGHLNRHLAIHKVAKPFTCEKCERRFSRREHLRSHLQTHDSNKDKQFICSTCQKAFTNKGYLRKHEIVHQSKEKLICDQDVVGGGSSRRRSCKVTRCGKTFKTQRTLNAHQAAERAKTFLTSEGEKNGEI